MSFYNRRRFLDDNRQRPPARSPWPGARARRAFAQDRRIRHFWWGNPERDKRTFAVIDIFNGKNPGIVVEGETLGFNDYFTKLTTQIARRQHAGRVPERLWQHGRVHQQGRRPSRSTRPWRARASISPRSIRAGITAGTFDGKLYGLTIGANSHVRRCINTRLWEAAGIKVARTSIPSTGPTTTSGRRRQGHQGRDRRPQGHRRPHRRLGALLRLSSARRALPISSTPMASSPWPQDVVVDYWEPWKIIRDAGGNRFGRGDRGPRRYRRSRQQTGLVTGKSAIVLCLLEPDRRHAGADAGQARRRHVSQHARRRCPGSSRSSRASSSASAATATTTSAATRLHERLRQRSRHDRGAGPRTRHPAASPDVRAALESKLTEAEKAVGRVLRRASSGKIDAAARRRRPSGVRRGRDRPSRRLRRVEVLLGQASIEDVAAHFMQEASRHPRARLTRR